MTRAFSYTILNLGTLSGILILKVHAQRGEFAKVDDEDILSYG